MKDEVRTDLKLKDDQVPNKTHIYIERLQEKATTGDFTLPEPDLLGIKPIPQEVLY